MIYHLLTALRSSANCVDSKYNVSTAEEQSLSCPSVNFVFKCASISTCHYWKRLEIKSL